MKDATKTGPQGIPEEAPEETSEQILSLQETPSAEDDNEVQAHLSTVSVLACHANN
jgi:hypothetical protein